MSHTLTNIGAIYHYKHRLGFLCPVKVMPAEGSKKFPQPRTYQGKNGEQMFAFALPGGGEIIIPSRGVRIDKRMDAK